MKKRIIDSIQSLKSPKFATANFVSTGISDLDIALNGGFRDGDIVEIYGDPSSAKTTLALMVTKEVQKKNFIPLYISTEDTYTASWLSKIDIDKSKLIQIKINDLDNIKNQILKSLENGIKLIVIDSLTAAILDNAYYTDSYISNMLRVISPIIINKKAILILINQYRHVGGGYIITTANTPIRVFSNIRIGMFVDTHIIKDNNIIGDKIKVNISGNRIKNKKTVYFNLYF